MTTRVCKVCHEEKTLDIKHFNQGKNKKKDGSIKFYFYKSCKKCSNKKDKIKNSKYKGKNRKSLSLKQQIYYQNHKEQDKIYKKLYYLKNKIRITKYNRIYIKNKRSSNINFRIKEIISAAIRLGLKTNNGYKNKQSCLKHLPYTIKELKERLESLFKPWMTWKNHGVYNSKTWNDNNPATWTWNIDHITPHSNFKYISMEDQAFRDCWALSNLRPLSSKQNILDGNRR